LIDISDTSPPLVRSDEGKYFFMNSETIFIKDCLGIVILEIFDGMIVVIIHDLFVE